MGKCVNRMSEKEGEFALNNWDKMTPRELAEKLNKPVKYLNQWLRYKGIKNIDGKSVLHAEDVDRFIELYPSHYCAEMVNFFPYLTKSQILSIGNRMGLRKKPELKQPTYTEEELLERFNSLSQKLGRNPMYDEFFQYKLPSYTTYVDRFGSIENVCKKLGMSYSKLATIYQGRHIGYIDENGKRYDSYREKYVEDILKSLGFNNLVYNKRYYQIKPELKTILGNRKFDWYSPQNDCFIEYFGMMKDDAHYTNKSLEKIKICRDNNIKLIEIYPSDINNRSFEAGKKNIQKRISQIL